MIRQITGIEIAFGGEDHEGWLPPGAARPDRTPERVVRLDLRLEEVDGGALLLWEGPADEFSGDNWYPTVTDAEEAARDLFGIEPHDWRPAA